MAMWPAPSNVRPFSVKERQQRSIAARNRNENRYFFFALGYAPQFPLVAAMRQEAEIMTEALKGCKAWEQDFLLPLAQKCFDLHLDDGMKVNYLMQQDVLAPIPWLAVKEE